MYVYMYICMYVCMYVCYAALQFVSLLLQSGDTALHLACFHGYLDIAKLLVKHGANLHIVNKVSQSLQTEHRTVQFLGHTCMLQCLIPHCFVRMERLPTK